MSGEEDPRRRLPSVDRLLRTPEAVGWIGTWGRTAVVGALRAEMDGLRSGASPPPPGSGTNVTGAILERAARRLRAEGRPGLRRVLNGTGVVLHTNLGRAPLSEGALENLLRVAGGYSNLEYDLAAGMRGDRYAHCVGLVRSLTGSEDVLVVNNTAAAVALTVACLAPGKHVLVSRGELVEIGGSFRVPEIVAAAGGLLTEVGTTNRTRIDDYRRAAVPGSGLILRVHPSNYRVEGFTETPGLEELVALGRELDLAVAHDLGSGLLLPDLLPVLSDEPSPRSSGEAGVDLTMWSGDKLLGGPQAGILHGRSGTIEALRRHPLARALRVDKLTLAALEATLLSYRDPERAAREVPALAALAEPEASVRDRAERARARLPDVARPAVRVVPLRSVVGGGALPGVEIPSAGWALDRPAAELEAALRACDPPLVARIVGDLVCLDFRTLRGEDEDAAVRLVGSLLTENRPRDPGTGGEGR